MNSEIILLKTVNRLPPELRRIINSFLPISTLKLVRKIHPNEIPFIYILMKDMNNYFYNKYIGYEMDINTFCVVISIIERRINKQKKENDYYIHSPNSNESLRQDIEQIQTKIIVLTDLYNKYKQHYSASLQQLHNYKIIIKN